MYVELLYYAKDAFFLSHLMLPLYKLGVLILILSEETHTQRKYDIDKKKYLFGNT